MEPGLSGEESAQLAYERTNKISYDMLEQGADVHATETRAFDAANGPDVYINGDDVGAVTVTIDPLRDTHWIRDDSQAWKGAATQHRGAAKDHGGFTQVHDFVKGLDPLIGAAHLSHMSFIPTLNDADKFTPRCVENSTRGTRTVEPDGKLPKFSRLIWENALPDTVDWRVDKQVVNENTHGSRSRRFNCGEDGFGGCR